MTLRQLRMQRKLTVEQLAEASRVSERQIRNLESGRAVNPRDETIFKLAEALEVEPHVLDDAFAEPEAA